MKSIVILMVLASLALARTQSDVALTWGHNKFDDDKILFGSAAFYGLRAGTMVDDTYGAQVGYEQTRAANCQGLTLRRYYVNGVVQTKLAGGLTPYALATLGYETSNKDYRPNQTFMGLGGGLKYNFSKNGHAFIETRALKSMDTKDVTWATTVGLGYTFDTYGAQDLESKSPKVKASTAAIIMPETPSYRRVQNVAPREYARYTPRRDTKMHVPIRRHNVLQMQRKPSRVKHYKRSKPTDIYVGGKGHYYVQIVALSDSSPRPYMQRLYKQGVKNVRLKKQRRNGEMMSLVVVGPYKSRASAARKLSRLKRANKGAFIKRI